ncbi:alpha/beta hydrolase fold domain-containing protein [Roseateles sp. SL47]|uniref:subtype B tannase n=1 Tax=Roseateles sp. SL47 TaxID=2995138 RepID=UPI00226F2367|nr:subtype B tannase [Roseateles sp. SL47]WAC74042.1 alpha/beta hydrolase fold domain-containing protein [Roseateles sp. SL47]
MNRRDFNLSLLAGVAVSAAPTAHAASTTQDALRPDLTRYTTQEVKVGEHTIRVRAYEGLPTVAKAVEPDYQALNLYIPEAYFQGGSVGGFTARTAPIFLPNGVGGYMPAKPGGLINRMPGPPGQTPAPSASAVALTRGFVVAAPGARGRTLQAADGRWTGKAPAAIVDLKAAVRWLRHNADRLPGNTDRIVSNGTSAGGALSALLGASGNHPDYEADLRALGAAPTRDDIFAVSAFCPITNLAHADEAYEWQFEGLREFRNIAISMLDFRVQRKEVVGQLSDAQVALSGEMRQAFVAYVNALGLKAPDGSPLTLETNGQGRLREHIAGLLQASAQQVLDGGRDLSDVSWLQVQGGRVRSVDFSAYARTVGRMKAQPAFDGFSLETGENQLFGDASIDKRHFTDYSLRHSTVSGAARADAGTVKSMDAMQQLLDARAKVSSHWRIRHGSVDRDTSLAVPTLLAAAARQRGAAVDLALPWGRPHSGDYDLEALFDWAEAAVRQSA